MAGEVENLSGKLGLDTTDYKTAVAAADRAMRVLETGFRSSAAALGDWTKSATGLENRATTLTNKLDIQRAKVEALAAEHKRLADENGANSRAAQDAEIKLNRETETLNKMQVELTTTQAELQRLGDSEQEAADAADDMGSSVEESGSKLDTFKGIMAGVGVAANALVAAVAAIGAAAIAAVAAIGGIALKAANTAEELTDLSNQTGISTTRLQELKYAGEIVGTSLDTITGAQARLVRSMFSAKDGTGSQAEAFKALGISVTDVSGNMRDTQTVFNDALDALAGITNPAERDALAMQLFGKSAQELNPLIKAGSSELAKLSAEAHRMGAVMSEEDVAAASAFKDQLDGLQMGFQGIVSQIGIAFLPGLAGIADQAKGYLQDIAQVVSGADGDIGKMASGLGDVLGRIVTDMASQAPQIAQAGIDLVQSILDAILQALPSLIEGGLGIINALIDFVVQNAPLLVNAAVQIITALVQGLLPQLPRLVEAALQIIISLANGLTQMLPELIPTIVDVVIQIVQTLVDNLPMLINAALQLILALTQGLIAALPVLIANLPQIIQAIIDALINSLPMILDAAGQLIGMLATGIVASIPVIILAIGELIARLGESLAKFIQKLPETGKAFVQGLINGIKNASGMLYQAVVDLANKMIESIKQALGIASPSKKGIAIGKNLMLSTAIGADQAMRDVERSFATFSAQISGAMNGGTRSTQNVNNSNRVDVWGNVVIQGSTPAGSLGAALTAKRI